jgi:hypothetical protein
MASDLDNASDVVGRVTWAARRPWKIRWIRPPGPTGLQNFYVEARYKVSRSSGGPFSYFDGLLLIAQYHEFRSAVRDLDYGSEFDFYAYLPLRNGVYAQLKFANYQADELFTDVEKVILGLGYQY